MIQGTKPQTLAYESQTGAAVDAYNGHRSALPQAQLEPPRTRPSSVSVLVARREDRIPQPRLEHRYYIPSDAWRLSLSGGSDRLVQPFRDQLGTVQYDGNGLLPGGSQRGVPLRPTRNLELRSRLAVYFDRVPGSTQATQNRHQYGWAWPGARQCVHRAAVALAQIRKRLSERVRDGKRGEERDRELDRLLQRAPSALFAGRQNPGRSILATTRSRDPDFDDPAGGGMTPNFHLKSAPKLSRTWGPPH